MTAQLEPGESRPGTVAQRCPFGDRPCDQTGRHSHDYEVHGRFGTRRCQCGSRHYQIVSGGPLPPRVVCAMCRKENYPATCYENGRLHGPRRIEAADAGTPF